MIIRFREKLTFKTRVLGQMKGRIGPTKSILGVASTGGQHFMKCSYPISRTEFDNIRAHSMNIAGDIIALIDGWCIWFGSLGSFPIPLN